MSQIHLLVPCSAKKSSSAPEMMYISKHKTPNLSRSIEAWVNAFNKVTDRCTASQLYSGQAFQYAQNLAKQHNFKISILSAGFGLVTSDTKLPGYNATFASNVDKVLTPHSSWWSAVCESELPGTSIFQYVKNHSQDKFVLCVGNEYLRAIQNDLLHVLESQAVGENQIVIIASNIPKKLQPFKSVFIRASRKVLQHPKATKCGLAITDRNITSIATHLFVEQLRLTNRSFSAIIRALNKELENLTVPKRPSRAKRDDNFILAFIEQGFRNHREVSQSLLFNLYKEEGNACTDTRFRTLYNRIKLTKVQRD